MSGHDRASGGADVLGKVVSDPPAVTLEPTSGTAPEPTCDGVPTHPSPADDSMDVTLVPLEAGPAPTTLPGTTRLGDAGAMLAPRDIASVRDTVAAMPAPPLDSSSEDSETTAVAGLNADRIGAGVGVVVAEAAAAPRVVAGGTASGSATQAGQTARRSSRVAAEIVGTHATASSGRTASRTTLHHQDVAPPIELAAAMSLDPPRNKLARKDSISTDISDHLDDEEHFVEDHGPHDAKQDDSVKRRRRLLPEETQLLLSEFARNPTPSANVRTQLGNQLQMSPRAIQIWFQNRRAKVKRSGGNLNGIAPPLQSTASASPFFAPFSRYAAGQSSIGSGFAGHASGTSMTNGSAQPTGFATTTPFTAPFDSAIFPRNAATGPVGNTLGTFGLFGPGAVPGTAAMAAAGIGANGPQAGSSGHLSGPVFGSPVPHGPLSSPSQLTVQMSLSSRRYAPYPQMGGLGRQRSPDPATASLASWQHHNPQQLPHQQQQQHQSHSHSHAHQYQQQQRNHYGKSPHMPAQTSFAQQQPPHVASHPAPHSYHMSAPHASNPHPHPIKSESFDVDMEDVDRPRGGSRRPIERRGSGVLIVEPVAAPPGSSDDDEEEEDSSDIEEDVPPPTAPGKRRNSLPADFMRPVGLEAGAGLEDGDSPMEEEFSPEEVANNAPTPPAIARSRPRAISNPALPTDLIAISEAEQTAAQVLRDFAVGVGGPTADPRAAMRRRLSSAPLPPQQQQQQLQQRYPTFSPPPQHAMPPGYSPHVPSGAGSLRSMYPPSRSALASTQREYPSYPAYPTHPSAQRMPPQAHAGYPALPPPGPHMHSQQQHHQQPQARRYPVPMQPLRTAPPTMATTPAVKTERRVRYVPIPQPSPLQRAKSAFPGQAGSNGQTVLQSTSVDKSSPVRGHRRGASTGTLNTSTAMPSSTVHHHVPAPLPPSQPEPVVVLEVKMDEAPTPIDELLASAEQDRPRRHQRAMSAPHVVEDFRYGLRDLELESRRNQRLLYAELNPTPESRAQAEELASTMALERFPYLPLAPPPEHAAIEMGEIIPGPARRHPVDAGIVGLLAAGLVGVPGVKRGRGREHHVDIAPLGKGEV